MKLYQNQFLIEQRDISLKPGVNEFRAPNLHAEGTFVSYEVEVLPRRRYLARKQSRHRHREHPRASRACCWWIATSGRRAPLADALRAREDRRRNARPRAASRSTLEDLQQFDLFLLSDVSALRLGREQMELYRRWVQELGGGFVMLGGENSYGVGGYYRTPIEQMLPVRMEHEDRQETPSVARARGARPLRLDEPRRCRARRRSRSPTRAPSSP